MPASGAGILQHGHKLRLQQFGIQEQQQGRSRVDHIYSGNAAVAEVLFWKEERLCVRTRYQLVGGEALAICERRETGVFVSPLPFQIGRKAFVEGAAALAERRIVPRR